MFNLGVPFNGCEGIGTKKLSVLMGRAAIKKIVKKGKLSCRVTVGKKTQLLGSQSIYHSVETVYRCTSIVNVPLTAQGFASNYRDIDFKNLQEHHA